MSDWTTSLSTAIDIAKRLREANEKIKNLEFANLIADLNLEFAELKLKMAGVVEENVRLKARIRELESIEADPCPKCRKRTWELENSRPHPMFGDSGVFLRNYKCSECGFEEQKLITPGG